MAYTFLSASSTKTYFAPSLTHFTVHSAAPSWAAFAPHLLSVMYPVKLASPANANALTKRATTRIEVNRIFMTFPPQTARGPGQVVACCGFRPPGFSHRFWHRSIGTKE